MKRQIYGWLLPLLLLATVVATVRVDDEPAVQQSENGAYLLVLNKTSNTAWQLDAASGEKVAEYPTDTGPHEVAVSPDHTRAALTNYGAGTPGNTLTIINLRDRKVDKEIDLSPYGRPHGIQWFSDGRRVIVSVEAQQSVAIVDVDRGAIETAIRTDQSVSHMVELSPDEKRVYVPNIGSGSTTVIDIPGRRIVKTISTGDGAEGIALVNSGSEVWVSNRAANTLSVIDAEELAVTETLQSRSFPIRAEASPNGRWVAVSNAESGEISVFDTAGKELVARVSTETEAGENGVPIGLTFSGDSSRLYVANSEARQVVVIDTGGWSVIDRFETGETPDGIAWFTENGG